MSDSTRRENVQNIKEFCKVNFEKERPEEVKAAFTDLSWLGGWGIKDSFDSMNAEIARNCRDHLLSVKGKLDLCRDPNDRRTLKTEYTTLLKSTIPSGSFTTFAIPCVFISLYARTSAS